ncbi:dTDP-4-amino-4,6-dideoxygalactose transaminase [Bradyrhizobium shewense]|uniref:dTDP-4-amino-4,6-dideoxygalactose transaminase n=1 Tax=Bradyrhizobium shewense TaxID=1761772 RepID=A0A1C3WRB4_9BRAD|nr:DegT/DnrJ/EryC1/StrS family aminotransferase [Bradyrhizobium shewense]SCB42602.1 dTDP-4-amino-4,6-dideoxygalactose transaminase [Bradyrhizobium shewense]
MILINNLQTRYAHRRRSIDAAIAKVIDRGYVVLGPEVKNFEAAFARYVGVSHCIGLGNGTDAIELALRGLGVTQGDMVATVANAGMYTTTAMLAIGASPHFMDVAAESHHATLEQVVQAVDAGCRAVVITHLYGAAVRDIASMASYCHERNVPLIEDCAQAHGAKIDGRQVGSFGRAASFSFYPTKNLGGLGDGGAVVTSDDTVANRIAKLRQYGWSSKYVVTLAGAKNSRLDELQASILSELLPFLGQDNARRREIAARYSASIFHPFVEPPPVRNDDGYVAHLYVIRVCNRDQLRAHLNERGVAAEIHYPIPDHRQPLLSIRCSGITLPITEQNAQQTLTLPCYPEMTDEEVGKVIEAVNSWVS